LNMAIGKPEAWQSGETDILIKLEECYEIKTIGGSSHGKT